MTGVYTDFNDKLRQLLHKLKTKRGDDPVIKQYQGRVYIAIDSIPNQIIDMVGENLFKYHRELGSIPVYDDDDDDEPSSYNWSWFINTDFSGDIKSSDRGEANDIKYLIGLVKTVIRECSEQERIDIYDDIMDMLDMYADHKLGNKN